MMNKLSATQRQNGWAMAGLAAVFGAMVVMAAGTSAMAQEVMSPQSEEQRAESSPQSEEQRAESSPQSVSQSEEQHAESSPQSEEQRAGRESRSSDHSPADATGWRAPYPELHTYLQRLASESPELLELRSVHRARLEGVQPAGALSDPELAIAFDLNPMQAETVAGRFSVSAMQMFPWFGTRTAQREMEQASADAFLGQVKREHLEQASALQQLYVQLVALDHRKDLIRAHKIRVEELERLALVRYETARAAQTDLLRIEMELERLKNRLQNLQDEQRPVLAAFNSYLGRTPEAPVRIAAELIDWPLPEQWAGQLRSQEQVRPEFDEIDARRRQLHEQQRLAQLAGRPSFGLGIEVMGRDYGPMSMDPTGGERVFGMAAIRVPLYRSQYTSRQRQAREELQALEYRRERVALTLSSQTEQALQQWREADRSLQLLSEELLPRMHQAIELLVEEYATGRARFDELLLLQRELLDLHWEQVDALLGQNEAMIQLESLLAPSM